MKNIINFIRYDNTIPLIVGVMFLGASATFASTDAGQSVLVGKDEKVISVDNTYIASKDLSTYTPTAAVTKVQEDTDNFYVDYTLSTIDLVGAVWQDTTHAATLHISKDALASFKDLASYVRYELSQVIDAEKDRLVRTQDIEKKNITQKTTVTTYSGLVGMVLNDTTVVADPFAPAPESKTPGVYVEPAGPQVAATVVAEQPTLSGSSATPIIDTSVITSSTTIATSTKQIITSSTSTSATSTELATPAATSSQAASVNAPVTEAATTTPLPASLPPQETLPSVLELPSPSTDSPAQQ